MRRACVCRKRFRLKWVIWTWTLVYWFAMARVASSVAFQSVRVPSNGLQNTKARERGLEMVEIRDSSLTIAANQFHANLPGQRSKSMRKNLVCRIYRRTRLDTALPRIYCSGVRIRDQYRHYWVTVISRRRRFIPTSPTGKCGERTTGFIPGRLWRNRSPQSTTQLNQRTRSEERSVGK